MPDTLERVIRTTVPQSTVVYETAPSGALVGVPLPPLLYPPVKLIYQSAPLPPLTSLYKAGEQNLPQTSPQGIYPNGRENPVLPEAAAMRPDEALTKAGWQHILPELPELVIAGYASPQVLDKEKHLITRSALKGDLPRFLAHPKFRNANLLHSNIQVGEVLPTWVHPQTGQLYRTHVDKVGLFVVIRIRTDPFRPPILDKVINDIREGRLSAFSISADAPFEARRHTCAGGVCFYIIDEIFYYEITVCEIPVNGDALATILTKSASPSLIRDAYLARSFCDGEVCSLPPAPAPTSLLLGHPKEYIQHVLFKEHLGVEAGLAWNDPHRRRLVRQEDNWADNPENDEEMPPVSYPQRAGDGNSTPPVSYPHHETQSTDTRQSPPPPSLATPHQPSAYPGDVEVSTHAQPSLPAPQQAISPAYPYTAQSRHPDYGDELVPFPDRQLGPDGSVVTSGDSSPQGAQTDGLDGTEGRVPRVAHPGPRVVTIDNQRRRPAAPAQNHAGPQTDGYRDPTVDRIISRSELEDPDEGEAVARALAADSRTVGRTAKRYGITGPASLTPRSLHIALHARGHTDHPDVHALPRNGALSGHPDIEHSELAKAAAPLNEPRLRQLAQQPQHYHVVRGNAVVGTYKNSERAHAAADQKDRALGDLVHRVYRCQGGSARCPLRGGVPLAKALGSPTRTRRGLVQPAHWAPTGQSPAGNTGLGEKRYITPGSMTRGPDGQPVRRGRDGGYFYYVNERPGEAGRAVNPKEPGQPTPPSYAKEYVLISAVPKEWGAWNDRDFPYDKRNLNQVMRAAWGRGYNYIFRAPGRPGWSAARHIPAGGLPYYIVNERDGNIYIRIPSRSGTPIAAPSRRFSRAVLTHTPPDRPPYQADAIPDLGAGYNQENTDADEDYYLNRAIVVRHPQAPPNSEINSYVYRKLREDYPPDVIRWAKADWIYDPDVPLDEIDMDRRPGGRDEGRTQAITDAIEDGQEMDPLVLVKKSDGRYAIADGYHRSKAYERLGVLRTPAFVAEGVGDHGPWDKAMHDAKLNKTRIVRDLSLVARGA